MYKLPRRNVSLRRAAACVEEAIEARNERNSRLVQDWLETARYWLYCAKTVRY